VVLVVLLVPWLSKRQSLLTEFTQCQQTYTRMR